MIASVALAAVPVPVDVLAGEYAVDGVVEIRFRTAARLHEGNARCRMWDEDVAQAVALATAVLGDIAADICDQSIAGLQPYELRLHGPMMAAHMGFMSRGPLRYDLDGSSLGELVRAVA